MQLKLRPNSSLPDIYQHSKRGARRLYDTLKLKRRISLLKQRLPVGCSPSLALNVYAISRSIDLEHEVQQGSYLKCLEMMELMARTSSPLPSIGLLSPPLASTLPAP
jgi:hypothetical protein